MIGITMRLEIETNRYYLGRDYGEALHSFGGTPIHISLIPNRKYIRDVLRNIDGILLPGSDSDIDPYYYSEDPIPQVKKVIPEKDTTDLLILEEADKLNLPVFAICYGMQALNVFYGGSLIQDIETQIENPLKHQQGFPLNRLSHLIKVKSESKLSTLIKKAKVGNEIKVNSHHHQSVKNVGRNLHVTAWTNDDVIECIESTDESRFVMGVQWHPEISFNTDELSKQLFERFVEECKKFAKTKSDISK